MVNLFLNQVQLKLASFVTDNFIVASDNLVLFLKVERKLGLHQLVLLQCAVNIFYELVMKPTKHVPVKLFINC